jgi:hypothetical protein
MRYVENTSKLQAPSHYICRRIQNRNMRDLSLHISTSIVYASAHRIRNHHEYPPPPAAGRLWLVLSNDSFSSLHIFQDVQLGSIFPIHSRCHDQNQARGMPGRQQNAS